MNKLLGASIATGVASASAVGALYFKPWEKGISVKESLEKLDRSILTSASDSRWDIKVHIYTTSISTKLNLKINDKDTITKEELSSWCSSTLEKTNSEDLHNKAKEWCLAPSVRDKLSKEKKTISDSLSTKLGEYKKHKTDDDKKIPLDQMENKAQDNLQEEDFKKWCNTYSQKELREGEDKNYDRIAHWCTA
ncbi:hypothetical protein HF1_01520 [Mycoplasma haemofelis str. Langford 1]|uniref:Uncharacterized protein n=2 Tax=Mycoplasma haemofelis TaxID=29501 RepID=F6FG07_MYCHI|nr:hypothetical protein [Mycoplasma haemofelis]AEG72473.1 hypothetical protein MHF_0172 [Mycoplasma haemofelis Ohio2]CBY92160.1 hypothetical protein HF1_01520 [Mycoplasma haemofelis str. Langford 1]